ncbi:MAG: hypothetical protein ACO2PO_15200, partial [Candidatus Calescibacterium sp.]
MEEKEIIENTMNREEWKKKNKIGLVILKIFLVVCLPIIVRGEKNNQGDKVIMWEGGSLEEKDEISIRKAVELLPILPLERKRREVGRASRMYIGFADEIFRGKLIPKAVPNTATLAIEGVGCAFTSGNFIGPRSWEDEAGPGGWAGSFQRTFADEVLNIINGNNCPSYDPNGEVGWCNDKDWPSPSVCVDADRDFECDCPNQWGGCLPGCDNKELPDCGYRQKIGDIPGEFWGFFQELSERLRDLISSEEIKKTINSALCGKGVCMEQPDWTGANYFCFSINEYREGSNDNYRRCYGKSSNSGWVGYFNKVFVEVFPNPKDQTIDIIILLWAEGEVPGDPQGIPNFTHNADYNISSEICINFITCNKSGWGQPTRKDGGTLYMDAVAIRVQLRPIIKDNLLDLCFTNTDIDFINAEFRIGNEGCVHTYCSDPICQIRLDNPCVTTRLGGYKHCLESLRDRAVEEKLGKIFLDAFDKLLHGDCPNDKKISFCPNLPSGSSFLDSGTWGQCMVNFYGGAPYYCDGFAKCKCVFNYGEEGYCKHGLFPIDLNELLSGRSFSVTQYCGRPGAGHDNDPDENTPPEGNDCTDLSKRPAHCDPEKCYRGHYQTSDPPISSFNPLPDYGTIRLGNNVYDVGCYVNQGATLSGGISSTGCSFYLNTAIRPRQSSLEVESCADQSLIQSFSQYPKSPTYTLTQGFRFITSRGGGNYVPEPLNREYDLFSLPLLVSVSLDANGGNWDDGYAKIDINQAWPYYFPFYKHLHNFYFTRVCMSTNGYIRLGENNNNNSWFNLSECTSPRPKAPMSGTRNPDVSPWISPLWADLSFKNEYVYYVSAVEPATWVSIKRLNNYSYQGAIIQDLLPYPDGRCRIMGAMGLPIDPPSEFDNSYYVFAGNVYSNCACSYAKVPSSWKCQPCAIGSICQDFHNENDPTYQGCVFMETPKVIEDNNNSYFLFRFIFYGEVFDHVCITDNGFIYFTNNPNGCTWNKYSYNQRFPSMNWIPNYSIAVLWQNYDPLTAISKPDKNNCGNCSGGPKHRGQLHGFGSVYKKYIQGPCPMNPQIPCRALVISWMKVANHNIIHDKDDQCYLDNKFQGQPLPGCTRPDLNQAVFDDKYSVGRDWCQARDNNGDLIDCGCNVGVTDEEPTCTPKGGEQNNNCTRICNGCYSRCWNLFIDTYRKQVLYTNTFQVVLWSDGTIDINVREYTDPRKVSERCKEINHVPRIFIKKDNNEFFLLTYDHLPPAPFSFRLFPMGYVYGWQGLCGTNLGTSYGIFHGYSTSCKYQDDQSGAACHVFEWRNAHVWGTPICVSTKAILWKRFTGTGQSAWANYDIDFIIDRLEVAPAGPFANLSKEERWQLALKYPYFRRSFGVDGPILSDDTPSGGAWSYLPTPCNISPQGCKIAMRWRGDPYVYWIGLAVSQDFLTDLANMIYTGGMCFSANVGGVNPQDQDKYRDIFKGLIPANLSSADSASSLFPFIKEICDPDGQVELRFKPSGVTQATARTGIEFPSDKVAGADFATFPYEGALGVNIPQTCNEWGYGRCADIVFGFPSYKMELWCNQNNLGPGKWIKDGHVGAPIYALAMTMSWLLGVDIEYPQVSSALTVSLKVDPNSPTQVWFKVANFDGGFCTIHFASSNPSDESDILEYWIRLDTNDTICYVDTVFIDWPSGMFLNEDTNGVPIDNPKLLCPPDENCTGGFNPNCKCPELNWYRVRRKGIRGFGGDITFQRVGVVIKSRNGQPGNYSCDIMGIKILDRYGNVKCTVSNLGSNYTDDFLEKFKNPKASVPYSVAFRRTGDIFFFLDLK